MNLRAFFGISALALLSGPALAGQITEADFASLPTADVVILGEVHDNPAHHEYQAAFVAHQRPAALVFEMLTPEMAAKVTPELRQDRVALATALEWEASGWPDFAYYHPIIAASDAAIYGAALPRDQVRRAVSDGAADVFGADAEAYGLTSPLSAEQQATREALQQTAHCDALPPAMLPGMVAAQRLRDAALARAVVQARAETDGPVVVITGNGHARTDWGLAVPLHKVAPELSVLSIGQLEEAAPDDAPYDHWRVTDPAPRDDPCAAFKTN